MEELYADVSCEDTQQGEAVVEEPPYDDSKDHDPCPDCNANKKGFRPGWYVPLVGPAIMCDRCDGAGWV